MTGPGAGASISVVVPTFRRADLLGELLEATAAQMRGLADPGIELVVVDNCPDQSARAVTRPFLASGAVRYIAEPRAGVVHARNAGVRAARGAHVLFLDDDEVPAPGWLAAFRAAALGGADMAIGRIVARYANPPPPHLRALLERLYARDCPAPPLAVVAARDVRLGTGNALFRRALLDREAAFDPRFNRAGGEDMFLIGGLLARGVRVVWVPDGLVEEIVPADRMQPEHLGRRRFTQGQIRCLVIAAAGGPRAPVRLAFWMGVGLVQTTLYGARGLVARLAGRETDTWRIRMQGGLGKLFWRRRAAALSYSGDAAGA